MQCIITSDAYERTYSLSQEFVYKQNLSTDLLFRPSFIQSPHGYSYVILRL